MKKLLLVLTLLISGFVSAQEDDPSVKDHPGIPRFPGTVITSGAHNDFGAHEFDTGGGKLKRVEGKYWRIDYELKEGAKVPGPLEVARNYGNQFKKRGGAVMMEQVDSGGGQVVMKMSSGTGDLWLDIGINNGGEMMTFTIVAEMPMVQKVEVSADEMVKALATSGRIALYGILFDTGKDTIKPESVRELTEVVTLLSGNPALKLRIEGHTDNVGKATENLTLSRKRAEAVKRWLVGKGIADARLESAGLGDTKPATSNDGEQGRAKNRRVELVKK